MRKRLESENLQERPAARAMTALALAVTLAAVGCTTNRMPGNGEPTYGTPAGGTAPTSSATPGSSSGTTGTPPPMTSSYRNENEIQIGSAPQRLSPDDAAAIIASQRRVVVLGTSAPGAADRPYVSDGRTNQFTYPALQTNPQLTVNSSIHSVNSAAAITSGAGTVLGTSAAVAADAAVFPATGTIVTPTNAALGVSPGVVAGGAAVVTSNGAVVGTTGDAAATVIPTTSALNVSPTVASGSGGARAVGIRGAATAANGGATANSVVITNAGGRVTVTNAPSRSQ